MIKDIMTKEVITVKEDDTAEKCARLLSQNNLSGLPVLDDNGKLVGMVTEGDLIRRASELDGPAYLEIFGGIFYLDSPKEYMDKLRRSMGQIVRDIMTRDIVTAKLNDKVEDVATVLVRNKLKRLPVVDEDRSVIGIVSRKDIMNYLFRTE
ncbi:MAG TPA: CBS domain-containing protein [Tissierellaceae bacterium]|nr:CBS domain-containing protein [Tissierellaceae bacterium]